MTFIRGMAMEHTDQHVSILMIITKLFVVVTTTDHVVTILEILVAITPVTLVVVTVNLNVVKEGLPGHEGVMDVTGVMDGMVPQAPQDLEGETERMAKTVATDGMGAMVVMVATDAMDILDVLDAQALVGIVPRGPPDPWEDQAFPDATAPLAPLELALQGIPDPLEKATLV